jgi:heme-degrading monooxygenase HmoA
VLTPSHRSQIERQSAFVIIWEFRINPRKRRAFERAYGQGGDWAKFFKTGKGYLGTELIQDAQQPDRYLTMDYWLSRANYETFMKQNREMYKIIDHRCEALTRKEVEIGKFSRRRPSVAIRNSKD